MKRLRIWFWRSLSDLFSLGVQWACLHAVKACGCDSCRLQFDPIAREAAVRRMFERAFAEAGGGQMAGKPDDRPS